MRQVVKMCGQVVVCDTFQRRHSKRTSPDIAHDQADTGFAVDLFIRRRINPAAHVEQLIVQLCTGDFPERVIGPAGAVSVLPRWVAIPHGFAQMPDQVAEFVEQIGPSGNVPPVFQRARISTRQMRLVLASFGSRMVSGGTSPGAILASRTSRQITHLCGLCLAITSARLS